MQEIEEVPKSLNANRTEEVKCEEPTPQQRLRIAEFFLEAYEELTGESPTERRTHERG